MALFVYLLVYPFLWLLSKLPFPLFYLFSDMVCLLVYHVARYRRKTVAHNLALVFPKKSSAERKRIERKFYRHMCDMFLEMVKSISISNKALAKRYVFTNIGEIRRLQELDKSIISLYGHYANYEWSNAIQLYDTGYLGVGIYKKVKNKYFDRMVHRIRGRFNAQLISTLDATKKIIKNERNSIRAIYAFVGDQSPKLNQALYWSRFMGVKCPTFTGGEKLARKLDMAVVYLHVEKPKRGHYVATFKTITDNAGQCEPHEITETFLRNLEAQIRKHPEFYLWSHKRWKHKDAPIPKNAITNF